MDLKSETRNKASAKSPGCDPAGGALLRPSCRTPSCQRGFAFHVAAPKVCEDEEVQHRSRLAPSSGKGERPS
jgi:hypothetical protein